MISQTKALRFKLFFAGLDLAQLIEGLSLGKRLMIPSLCPKPIGDMILKCFDIDPYLRPNFVEIKDILKLTFEKLFIKQLQNEKRFEVSNTEYMKPSNSFMKKRYLNILNDNMLKKTKKDKTAISNEYLELEKTDSRYSFLHDSSSVMKMNTYYNKATNLYHDEPKQQNIESEYYQPLQVEIPDSISKEAEVIIHVEMRDNKTE